MITIVPKIDGKMILKRGLWRCCQTAPTGAWVYENDGGMIVLCRSCAAQCARQAPNGHWRAFDAPTEHVVADAPTAEHVIVPSYGTLRQDVAARFNARSYTHTVQEPYGYTKHYTDGSSLYFPIGD